MPLSHPDDKNHQAMVFSFWFTMSGLKPGYLHVQQNHEVIPKHTKVSEYLVSTYPGKCSLQGARAFCALPISLPHQSLSNQWTTSASWDNFSMKWWIRTIIFFSSQAPSMSKTTGPLLKYIWNSLSSSERPHNIRTLCSGIQALEVADCFWILASSLAHVAFGKPQTLHLLNKNNTYISDDF